jgi:hypothetical protein
VRTLLADHKLLLKADTIVDATIIAAPSSTKNATQTRDPDMKQTRKGNQWYFGMKVHVGSDITQLDDLLHGQERTLFGDHAYFKQADQAQWKASGGAYRINRRGKRTANTKRINRAVAHAESPRTCLSRGEAALGLHDGAVSRPREEHHAGADDVCVGEPVLAAETAGRAGHVVSVHGAPPGDSPRERHESVGAGASRAHELVKTVPNSYSGKYLVTCAALP